MRQKMDLLDKHREWIDPWNLIHEKPLPYYSENGITFLAVLVYLEVKSGHKITENDIIFIKTAISYHDRGDGIYSQTPTATRVGSHDTLIGIAYLKNVIGETQDISPYGKLMHPKDIILLDHLRGRKWAKYGLWFLYLTVVWSCFNKWKIRNGDVGKNIMPDVFRATDTKILALLKFELVPMDKTRAVCELLLRYNWGENHWIKILNTYFKILDHPINIAAKKFFV